MFLTVRKRGYSRRGEQFCHGYFLVLMQCDKYPRQVRATVKYARMSQCGHFMMGEVKVAGQKVVLSGSYGADGLTCDVPEEVFLSGVPLPDDLYQAWAKGGGHNSAGSEAPAMRKWGLETFRGVIK